MVNVRVCSLSRISGLRGKNSENVPDPHSMILASLKLISMERSGERGWVLRPPQPHFNFVILDALIFPWISWPISENVPRYHFIGSKQTLQRTSMEMKEKPEVLSLPQSCQGRQVLKAGLNGHSTVRPKCSSHDPVTYIFLTAGNHVDCAVKKFPVPVPPHPS